MEYNERGEPLKRLSSLTNPKSAGLFSTYSDYVLRIKNVGITDITELLSFY